MHEQLFRLTRFAPFLSLVKTNIEIPSWRRNDEVVSSNGAKHQALYPGSKTGLPS